MQRSHELSSSDTIARRADAELEDACPAGWELAAVDAVPCCKLPTAAVWLEVDTAELDWLVAVV